MLWFPLVSYHHWYISVSELNLLLIFYQIVIEIIELTLTSYVIRYVGRYIVNIPICACVYLFVFATLLLLSLLPKDLYESINSICHILQLWVFLKSELHNFINYLENDVACCQWLFLTIKKNALRVTLIYRYF